MMARRLPAPDMSSVLRSRVAVSRRSGVLLVGDLLAIGVFVLAGEIRHQGTLASGALTFAEFAAGWLIGALVVGAYAEHAVDTRGRAAGIALAGWLLGGSAGQLIRAVVEPGFYVFPSFYAVTLGVGGVLLVAWRLLATELLSRSEPP